jgi:hypothetical protein
MNLFCYLKYEGLQCPSLAPVRYASGEVKHGVHFRRFSKEFLGRNRWYAIRISKSVLPRLKYIALYVTSPTCQITHYGRIRAIKPWRDSGKYIVLLRGKAKRIGPIEFSSKINIQAPRLALMARLSRARTLADAL